MNRDLAVVRIQDGLGFSARQSAKIILRLQEAQRDLEKGKTLPRFLVQELQTLSLTTGNSTVALPAGFLRIDDDTKPYFISSGSVKPTFLRVVRDRASALAANFSGEASGPAVMVLRNAVVDFINPADTNYTIYWSYYKADAVLDTNIENAWLAKAPDWLIGEAGWRMAMDARDKDAVVIFDNLRKTGRAATFGEIIASEESSGPIIMGANL